jgi:chorismate dehydratase
LNSVPLVWGMLHGAEQGLFDLEFALPSQCAERLASGNADVGLVPSIELARQALEPIPGAGVASRGMVRSILLVSKIEPGAIRTLAADTSSRTSVVLARIVLARRYAARPELVPQPPEVGTMLERADAAVLIGDPALRVGLEPGPYRKVDLGQEWFELTGLPMVFAVWACRDKALAEQLAPPLLSSCRFGRAHLEDIVRQEAAPRGLPESLARDYLTRRIISLLGEREYEGLKLFLEQARQMEANAHA